MGIAVSQNGPVALDTSVFIYYVEEHQTYLPLIEPLFEGAAAGSIQIVTSAITLLELLVVPYRSKDMGLAARYEELLTYSEGIRMLEVDGAQLRAAASLRASQRIRTVDAIQVAAALTSGCSSFITNDLRVPKIRGLRIVQLGDLV